jgi:hypothetical protein
MSHERTALHKYYVENTVKQEEQTEHYNRDDN